MAREERVGVTLSEYEEEIIAAVVAKCGYTDRSNVLRTLGIPGARELLARVAPAELARIDRRFGGGE